MPPASLSTLAVMMPGPITASMTIKRVRNGLIRCTKVISSQSSCNLSAVEPRQAPLPGGRDDLVERVVGSDDAVHVLLVVDDRHGQQIILGDRLGHGILAVRHIYRYRATLHKLGDEGAG